MPHHAEDVSNERKFRQGDWRLAWIKGNISFAPKEEQCAEDYDCDGDHALVESHDCLRDLVAERIPELLKLEKRNECPNIESEVSVFHRGCQMRGENVGVATSYKPQNTTPPPNNCNLSFSTLGVCVSLAF